MKEDIFSLIFIILIFTFKWVQITHIFLILNKISVNLDVKAFISFQATIIGLSAQRVIMINSKNGQYNRRVIGKTRPVKVKSIIMANPQEKEKGFFF